MDPFPRATQPPTTKGVVHRLPCWPPVRQQAPGATRAQDRHDGVYTGAQGMSAGPTGFCLRWQEGLRYASRGIGEAGQIGVACPYVTACAAPMSPRFLPVFSQFLIPIGHPAQDLRSGSLKRGPHVRRRVHSSRGLVARTTCYIRLPVSSHRTRHGPPASRSNPRR
jgi:hypothetical protein